MISPVYYDAHVHVHVLLQEQEHYMYHDSGVSTRYLTGTPYSLSSCISLCMLHNYLHCWSILSSAGSPESETHDTVDLKLELGEEDGGWQTK